MPAGDRPSAASWIRELASWPRSFRIACHNELILRLREADLEWLDDWRRTAPPLDAILEEIAAMRWSAECRRIETSRSRYDDRLSEVHASRDALLVLLWLSGLQRIDRAALRSVAAKEVAAERTRVRAAFETLQQVVRRLKSEAREGACEDIRQPRWLADNLWRLRELAEELAALDGDDPLRIWTSTIIAVRVRHRLSSRRRFQVVR
jgi:hypothetical protein